METGGASPAEKRAAPMAEFDRHRALRHLAAAGGLALIVRLLGAWFLGTGTHPQLWEYEEIAQNLLQRGEFVISYRDYGDYYALISPLYCYLTYLVYLPFGTHHLGMLVVQFLLALAWIAALYGLSWFLFADHQAALMTALLAAAHPAIAIYGATKLHQFNLYLALFYLVLLAAVWTHRKGSWLSYAVLGSLGGLAVLSRSTIFPFLLLAVATFVALNPAHQRKSRLSKGATCLALVLLINLPWTWRNYHLFGEVIFSQSNSWEAIWVGNNPISSGTNLTSDGRPIIYLKPPTMEAELEASDSELQDREIFKKHVLNYVREQPGRFLNGLLDKAWRFWWFYPQTGAQYPRSALILYKLVYLGLLWLTFLGLQECHRSGLWRRDMVYPFLLVLTLWGVHTLAFGEMRHRWTVEPVLLLFAGYGASRFLLKRGKDFQICR